MIVKENGWEGKSLQDLKGFIISDLFENRLVRFKQKSYDKALEVVDDFFYKLVASDTCYSYLLPALKYADRFYVFTLVTFPSGSTLYTLTMRLEGIAEPLILELIY